MLNEELDFFIVKFHQLNGTRWPFLRCAVKKLYDDYYKVNRTRPSLQQEEEEGEWVNAGDDVDDEIHFRINDNPEDIVPTGQLDDTLPYNQSPRQQDECQDQQIVEIEQPQQFP